MNARTIIATIALTLGAAPGFAAASPMNDMGSTMSRVEVRALANSEPTEAYSTVIPVSTMTRAQVMADLQVAKASGLLDNVDQTYGSFRSNQILSTASRNTVVADAHAGLSGASRGNYAGA